MSGVIEKKDTSVPSTSMENCPHKHTIYKNVTHTRWSFLLHPCFPEDCSLYMKKPLTHSSVGCKSTSTSSAKRKWRGIQVTLVLLISYIRKRLPSSQENAYASCPPGKGHWHIPLCMTTSHEIRKQLFPTHSLVPWDKDRGTHLAWGPSLPSRCSPAGSRGCG